MAVVALLVPIAVLALLTEEWPSFTFRVEADIGQGTFAMFGAVERQSGNK
jgi:hypothetical protein